MQSKEVKILYVDDEKSNLIGFEAQFRRYYTVFIANSANSAEEILSKNQIHVLITDQKMPGITGTRLLENSIKKYPEQVRIILTAYADNEAIIDAFQKGLIYRYVLKPFIHEELKEIIDKSYEIYCLNRLKETLYKEWIKTQNQFLLSKMKDVGNE